MQASDRPDPKAAEQRVQAAGVRRRILLTHLAAAVGAVLLAVVGVVARRSSSTAADLLGLLLLGVATALVVALSRRLWAVAQIDPDSGLLWTLTLTTLPAGELPTGTARLRRVGAVLPVWADDARARMVVAERYPHDPTWWLGLRGSYRPLRKIADAGERALVLSSPDGGHVLVGAPGRGGAVLTRIADPRVPAQRDRARRRALANRGLVLLVGVWAAARLAIALSVGVGPLVALVVLAFLLLLGFRAWLAWEGGQADRAARATRPTTLVDPPGGGG